MTEVIYFYRVNDPFGEFSNFYSAPIDLKGLIWPTTEHFFQAQKFTSQEIQEKIREEISPMEAAKLGRSRDYPLRPDWDNVRDDIMRQALMAKFTQHDKLKQLLLSTKGKQLVEHTKNDSYWADGGDGTGKNMLGILLMELRDKL